VSAEPMGFDPMWQAIKGWDICRESGGGYHGPTGDDVRAILSALTAAGLVVEQGWQPIATAPRDGTRVMFFAPAADGAPPKYRVDRWGAKYDAFEQMRPDQPYTYWRPLPAPPAAQEPQG